MSEPALRLTGVRRVFDEVEALRGVDWTITSGQNWIVLGNNGCGKTTLVRIASMWLHPSSGEVSLLGETLGRTDVRSLRTRVGYASSAMANALRGDVSAHDVVMTARYGALETWWHSYEEADHVHADEALRRVGAHELRDRPFKALSSGERQRVLLARALSGNPGLLLLDEPTAGLDLAGREALMTTLSDLVADPDVAPMVLVTHHVEEIPQGFTHVLMLRDGSVTASGPMASTLTVENLSECFGIDLILEQRHGRWFAWAN